MSLEHYDFVRAVCDVAQAAWEAPHTTEESIREFLGGYFGPLWRTCALQANLLDGRVVYTASRLVQLPAGLCQMVYVVDRDALGQWYVAPPSPVSGYIE